MHGAAVTLARHYRQLRNHSPAPDLILASDMLDLTTFLALTRPDTSAIPAAIYFHENQLTYPLPTDPTTGPMRRQRGERDLHYAWINFASALAADAVFFNSEFHRREFLDELPRLLKHFPDYNELATVEELAQKSRVLPLGLDLRRLDAHRPATSSRAGQPLLLWNHRWEYDKDPTTFFQVVYQLVAEGLDFGLIVLGESFAQKPGEFDQARKRLADRAHFGYVEDQALYARLLWQADIVVSTARHDFFGSSVVEAMYCECFPILPRRLAYPEHIPSFHECFYDDYNGLVSLLRQAIQNIEATRQFNVRQYVARYDWQVMAPVYDEQLAAITSQS